MMKEREKRETLGEDTKRNELMGKFCLRVRPRSINTRKQLICKIEFRLRA